MTAALQMQAKKPDPLEDNELQSILDNEIRSAINAEGSDIARRQEQALKYYEADLFGNEVEGSSTVVLHTVAEQIDWAMPALMRAFFYTSEIVQYEPVTPEDEPFARVRTKVINQWFREQLHGQRFTFDFAKAGLLEALGTGKFLLEKVREPLILEAAGISADQLTLLTQNPDMELLAATERIEQAQAPVPTPEGVIALPVQIPVYDVRYKEWREFHKACLETVPPEEFLCARDVRRIDQNASFLAHRKSITRSELHSYGVPWETVAGLPQAQGRIGMDGRSVVRNEADQSVGSYVSRADEASQMVMACESYIRVDYDGDGFSEMRRCLSAGDNSQTLLMHDYAPHHPFFAWTPLPMPHKLYGHDYCQVVEDMQRVGSTFLRQMIDNNVRMNNARHKIKAEYVDLDSYLDTAPGAPVLVEEMDAIEPLDVPALPPWAFEALQYFEKVTERRTGIHPYSQEAYSAGQNQTAQGISQVFEAAMAQVQLLAQMLGDGLADLFRLIPKEMKAKGMGPSQMRVGEEWISYNPQEWPDEVRCTINVGLSPGQTEQKIQRLLLLMGLQEKAMSAGGPGFMVTWDQMFSAAVRLVEQCGFPSGTQFFTSPAGKEPAPPPPDPKSIEAETNAKDSQSGRALELSRLQYEKEKDAANQARLERESEREHARELLRIESDERSRRYTAELQFQAAMAQVQAQKMATEAKEEGAENGSAGD